MSIEIQIAFLRSCSGGLAMMSPCLTRMTRCLGFVVTVCACRMKPGLAAAPYLNATTPWAEQPLTCMAHMGVKASNQNHVRPGPGFIDQKQCRSRRTWKHKICRIEAQSNNCHSDIVEPHASCNSLAEASCVIVVQPEFHKVQGHRHLCLLQANTARAQPQHVAFEARGAASFRLPKARSLQGST